MQRILIKTNVPIPLGVIPLHTRRAQIDYVKKYYTEKNAPILEKLKKLRIRVLGGEVGRVIIAEVCDHSLRSILEIEEVESISLDRDMDLIEPIKKGEQDGQ